MTWFQERIAEALEKTFVRMSKERIRPATDGYPTFDVREVRREGQVLHIHDPFSGWYSVTVRKMHPPKSKSA